MRRCGPLSRTLRPSTSRRRSRPIDIQEPAGVTGARQLGRHRQTSRGWSRSRRRSRTAAPRWLTYGRAFTYSGEAGVVTSLYQGVVGRAPSAAEISATEAQLASGVSLQAIRSADARSPEAVADLETIYQNVLGRQADASGLATWEDALAGGTSLAQVQQTIAQSPEAQARVQADSGLAISASVEPQLETGVPAILTPGQQALLDGVRAGRGLLDISTTPISFNDLAALQSNTANEFAVVQSMSGARWLVETGSTGGSFTVPGGVARLVAHTHPSSDDMAQVYGAKPSFIDINTLQQLNQGAIHIVTSLGEVTSYNASGKFEFVQGAPFSDF